MTTILLGSSGFLGPQIIAKYPDVISVGRTVPSIACRHFDCESITKLPQVLDGIDFDKVIMMIGSSDHHALNSDGTKAMERNVVPLKHLFSYLRSRPIQKVISFTSILLYDRNRMTLPVDESQAISPYENEYIFSKYLAEEVCRFHSDVPNIVARLTNIYGPTKAIGRPDVVNQLVERLIFDGAANVINTLPQRDFIFTEDAADAIMKLLDSQHTGPVNLASGQMHSIGEIVAILERISQKKIKVLGGAVTGHMKFVADISLIKRIVDWSPQYTIEQGLTKTYREMVALHG
jgi:UDP-glucuronate decarboxylase